MNVQALDGVLRAAAINSVGNSNSRVITQLGWTSEILSSDEPGSAHRICGSHGAITFFDLMLSAAPHSNF